ncbi:MAG: DNA polymerase IV [Calditrichaeota bacterium]|nr:DNA polymerase IV [Calditrichota bacterium]
MTRIILHVDMDAFFAAVEQREHPELKGKPVIVGADPKGGRGRGVVSTCSYEARKFGVHSAMPISQAYRLCPRGIYVRPNGKLYQQVSGEIFEIFYEFTDLVEPVSIDEAFLDVTGSVRLFGDGVSIAKKIKKRILEKEQLTASIGVAPNKYLAKIASDLEKPDGLVVVEPDEIETFLWSLDISKLWGAGQKTQQILRKMGIQTIGDLARFPRDILKSKLGSAGEHFYNLAHGHDNRPVVVREEVKSVSNEHTFPEDTADIDVLRQKLIYLCEKVGYRLRKKQLKGRTIHLKLRYENFSTITRNLTIGKATDRTREIFDIVWDLFEKNYMSGRKVRLLGVGVSGFGEAEGKQLSLFDALDEKHRELDKVQDMLVDRFGKHIIQRAESLKKPGKKKEG